MDKEILKIKDMKTLEALQNHEESEIVFVEETEQYMIYHDDKWYPAKIEETDSGLRINLYELSKQVVSQLPVFDDNSWEGAEKVFEDWITTKESKNFMLLGRDINYYTVFSPKEEDAEFTKLFEAVKECITFVGDVKGFDPSESGDAIEIWVQKEDAVTCMYLFEYDKGIVTYGSK